MQKSCDALRGELDELTRVADALARPADATRVRTHLARLREKLRELEKACRAWQTKVVCEAEALCSREPEPLDVTLDAAYATVLFEREEEEETPP